MDALLAGRLDEARQCFERVLTLDSNNYVALYSMGLMTVNAGDALRAREYLGRAISAHPDKTAPRLARATALGAQGLYDDAIADLDAAIPVVINAIVQNSGQTCSAGSRVLIEKSIYEPLLQRLGQAFKGLRAGPT